jgi:hypothetical protein
MPLELKDGHGDREVLDMDLMVDLDVDSERRGWTSFGEDRGWWTKHDMNDFHLWSENHLIRAALRM